MHTNQEDKMAANGASKTAEQLQSDMEQLRADVSAMMETIGKLAQDGKQEGARRVREVRDRVIDQAEKSKEAVESQIVERPLISVLAAFGVGMLLGRLLDRR
jgi:ElaB/YqjD/DUF883 family membrane-anchored ribosome-binding protein